jgi:hypothetical protein
VRYETRLVGYETKLVGYETRLVRYETRLVRYETKTVWYETRLVRKGTKAVWRGMVGVRFGCAIVSGGTDGTESGRGRVAAAAPLKGGRGSADAVLFAARGRGVVGMALARCAVRSGRRWHQQGQGPGKCEDMSENQWPQSRRQQIDWLLARIADWTANAADIGLDPTQVSAFSAALSQVQTARDDALATRTLAKGKTQTFYGMADPVIETAGGMIKTIRGYAATSGEPNVWELAHIDPPATPSPVPAPTIPTDIVTSLNNDGSIAITWTAKNAAPNAGTAFTVHRKLEGQSAYTQLATVGVRAFTDETVPPGTPSVQYMIRGIRGDKVGQFSEAVTVYLGKTPMNGEEGQLSLAA